MVIITDISVPAEQFELGRLFEEYPDIRIELERVVPVRDGVVPLLWTAGVDPAVVETAIRTAAGVRDVDHLASVGGRTLFEVRWERDVDAVVEPLVETEATVLRATGGANVWRFRVQFATHTQLLEFHQQCRRRDVTFHLEGLYDPAVLEDDAEGGLTAEQYAILAAAHEHGYWSVPRGITLQELADRLEISSNAASQRMRRGLDTLVGRMLGPGSDSGLS